MYVFFNQNYLLTKTKLKTLHKKNALFCCQLHLLRFDSYCQSTAVKCHFCRLCSENHKQRNNISVNMNMDKKDNDTVDPDCSAGTSASESSINNNRDTSQKLNIEEKLRVLCLHGYRQNGDMLRSKLGSFRKQVGKYAEFVFISAPHKAAPMTENLEVPDEQRSWWFNKEDHTFKGTNKDGPAYGFEDSLRFVEKVWQEQGPFQGLLGFSQGACFVGLICGLAQRKLTSISPRFAVIAAGFKSGSLAHKSAYEELIPIPTFHIYGTTDDIIPMRMSEELMEHFSLINVIEHPGGHYFPATTATKQDFVQFFQDRLVEFLEEKELANMSNIVYVNGKNGDEEATDSD